MLRFILITVCFFNTSVFAAVSKTRRHDYYKAGRSSCSEKTLSPLLSYKPIIVIDAGHGGNDEGAKVDGVIEKKITLKLAKLAKQALEFRGYKVRMTRSKDEYVSLSQRVEMSSLVKAKLFLSIHCNSSPINKDVHGVEIFYHDAKDVQKQKASRRFASQMLHCFLQQTGAHSRGVKKGNFYVIRETAMPAILVEIGFLTHFDERSLLTDTVYLEKIAHGIAAGMDRYFNY